jgi:hypothetical protein
MAFTRQLSHRERVAWALNWESNTGMETGGQFFKGEDRSLGVAGKDDNGTFPRTGPMQVSIDERTVNRGQRRFL